MSFLSRLKSMIRYSRLWPPPRHHDVSSPWLLRPPERCSFSVSGAYGSLVVISSNVSAVLPRTPGDVGLYLRIAISLRPLQELGQLLAFPERHVRLLRIRAAANEFALPLELAVRQRGTDGGDLRSEQRLDRPLDVDLVGVPRHLEHQRAPVLAEGRGLLGNQRTADDVSQFHDACPGLASAQGLLQFFEGSPGHHDPPRVHDIARADPVARQDADALDVAHRQRQLVFGFTSTSSARPSTPRRRSISTAAFVLISVTP